MKRGDVTDRKAYFASKFGPVPKLLPIRSTRGRPSMAKDPGRAREQRNAVIGEVVRGIMKRRKLKAFGACTHMATVVAGLARISDPGFEIERGHGTNRRRIAIGRSRTTEREAGENTATKELARFLHECFRQDEKRRKRVSALFDNEFPRPTDF